MIKIKQTKLHDPENNINGNCMAACFASLLELEIEEIPKFEDMDDDKWWPAVLKWLDNKNIYLLRLKEFYPPIKFIASGKSPRGNFDHVVIYNGEEMIHHPHPDNTGILNVNEIWILVDKK